METSVWSAGTRLARAVCVTGLVTLASSCGAEFDDETFDDDTLRAKPSLCIDEECVDGQQDIVLDFYLNNAEFRANAFKPGTKIHMSGREVLCFDSPCSRPYAVARSVNPDRLLAASFGNPQPGSFSDLDGPLAPLSIAQGEDLCEPYDAGCEDDTVYQRGAFRVVSHDDAHPGEAQVLDRNNGWAPGGFLVSARSYILGNASCQLSLDRGSVSIIRDACDADSDCPEPTSVDSCGPSDSGFDFFRARLLSEEEGEPYGAYDALCEVLSSTEIPHNAYDRHQVALDCVYNVKPRVYDW